MKLGKTIIAIAAGIALALGSTISAQAAETNNIQTHMAEMQNRILAATETNIEVQNTFNKYSEFDFQHDNTGTVIGNNFSWISFTGSNRNNTTVIQIRVAVINADLSIATIQQAIMNKTPDGIHTSIIFDDNAPLWEGIIKSDGTTISDSNYPNLKLTSQESINQNAIANYTREIMASQPRIGSEEIQPAAWSCRDVVNTVCDVAGSGDMAIACAILASSGWGGLGCAAVSWIIVKFGCAKLTSMICD